MEYKKLLISSPTKELFEQYLEEGIINPDAVGFIEEPREIWAQGNYYPCPYTKEELDLIFQSREDALIEKIEKNKNDIDSVYGAFEQHLKDAATALDGKVSWQLGNTTIVLPNHGQVVGEPNTQELEGKAPENGNASLLMLSKWNVIDLGSVKYPINLNGSKLRPTYNDTKELALLEDLEWYED